MQVEGVVRAVAEATTAQPSGGSGGSNGRAKGTNGAAPKWNQPSALMAGGRGPRWPLKVGPCLRPLLQVLAPAWAAVIQVGSHRAALEQE